LSDDTPTQRFDQQQPAEPGRPNEPPEKRKRGPLIPTLVAIGALLVVAVIVLGSLLLDRSDGQPQAAATDTSTNGASNSPVPVPTPTVTVTVTATPAPSGGGGSSQHPNGNNVLITHYSISPTTINCASNAPTGATNLSIKWSSLNGNIAYFGVNTVDAKTGGMGWNLPASGSDADFPTAYQPFTYPCGAAQEEYTLSVYGNGSEQSLQIVVKRQ
jgi:hypothetical protein